MLCVSSRTVDTTHGKISGRVLKTLIKQVEYYGFMGIPYAAPPIKDLRFMVNKNAFFLNIMFEI